MKVRMIFVAPPLLVASFLAGWATLRLASAKGAAAAPQTPPNVPSTPVKRGDVTFIVHAKGELQGGNTEVLAAPQVGGQALAITMLRESGELVQAGDTVVQFDTTDQEFKLKEAEADLAEAEQQVIQAEAESQAKAEEARLALVEAQSDLKLAQLEARRNEILPAIVAQENNLAVNAASDKARRLERDLNERLRTARAGIAIHQAGREKARVAAATAKRNIEAMTLRSKTGGYVAVQQNTDGNWRWGTYLPVLQIGDTVRAGVPVAQIPDLENWETTAKIGELDRAHLAVGQPAEITVVALPGKTFHGRIKAIGGTTGPPWNRNFDCRISLADASPELRPGMSANVRITTEVKQGVLWIPSQAVFDADGRKFVYAKSGTGFSPQNVKLVRRSESQAVIEGLAQGQVVALTNPDQMKRQTGGRGGAMQAIAR
ncbi:MAG: efflux RND transporter periplasmic adaptor subunit [Bryobacteraceae bacterium]